MNEMVAIARCCQWYAQPLSPVVSCGNDLYHMNDCHQKLFAHVCMPHILAVATFRGWRLFCSELLIVRLLFEGGDYSKNYSNSTLHSIIDCLSNQIFKHDKCYHEMW